jgi:mediator of RNA polymerase II transcription subunit 7
MADQAPAAALAAAFPTPPPFYKHFTPENIERIRELRAAHHKSDASHDQETVTDASKTNAPIIRLLDLPAELRYLQPPEPPANGLYKSFGDPYNVFESCVV